MQWLRSFVFTALLFVDTFLWAVAVLLTGPFGLDALTRWRAAGRASTCGCSRC
mgnify:CR=1 FL=1